MSGDNFRTPPEFFKELNESALGPFFWDACCVAENCLVSTQQVKMDYSYLTVDMVSMAKYFNNMALTNHSIFINPPYSRKLIKPIIEKAWEDAKHFRVVMLVRFDTTTDWFNMALEEGGGSMIIHRPVEVQEINVPPLWEYGDITVFPLRHRIKFYAAEEIMRLDGLNFPDSAKNTDDSPGDWFYETKNYVRVADGIVSKNCYNFPCCLMIFDRRGVL